MMEEIPLSDMMTTTSAQKTVYAPPAQPHPNHLLEEASKISGGEWMKKYQQTLAKAYAQGARWLNEDCKDAALWKLLEENEQTRQYPILLFEREMGQGNDDEDTFFSFPYIFRVESLVSGRAERYMYLFKDHNPETRLAWDSEWVKQVQQLETYRPAEGDLDVVKSHVSAGYRLYSDRFLLGVQSHSYTPATNAHVYTFKTEDHYYVQCPGNAVKADVLVFIWIKPAGADICELKMAVGIQPNGISFGLFGYKEKLRQRVKLWERVVGEWDRYYGEGRDPKILANRK